MQNFASIVLISTLELFREVIFSLQLLNSKRTKQNNW